MTIQMRLLPTQIAKPSVYYNTKGFTLVEIMVTMSIIAILAAIAIPSYRNYAQLNFEEEARQRMLSVANDLSRWRAKNLSYLNFVPINDGCIPEGRCYSNDNNDMIYVPLGSTEDNYTYKLILKDGKESVSLVSPKVTQDNPNPTKPMGQSWHMVAEPNRNNGILAHADAYYMDDKGRRFKFDHTVASSLDIAIVPVASGDKKIQPW